MQTCSNSLMKDALMSAAAARVGRVSRGGGGGGQQKWGGGGWNVTYLGELLMLRQRIPPPSWNHGDEVFSPLANKRHYLKRV